MSTTAAHIRALRRTLRARSAISLDDLYALCRSHGALGVFEALVRAHARAPWGVSTLADGQTLALELDRILLEQQEEA